MAISRLTAAFASSGRGEGSRPTALMASATWDANFSLNPTLNYKQTTNELFKRFTSKIVPKRWKGWSQIVCRGYR